MAELKLLVIHCADTHPNYKLSKGILQQWHMGPKDINDKTKLIGVKYLGDTYDDRKYLPDDYIDMRPIQELHGRGWDRLGYSDMIHRDGSIENLTPYNADDWVSSDEMTWGATGYNSTGRHIVLEGGRTLDNKSLVKPFSELFTDAMFTSLVSYVKQFIKDHPGDKIAGHYMLSKKTCPNFLIEEFFALANINPKHIFKK